MDKAVSDRREEAIRRYYERYETFLNAGIALQTLLIQMRILWLSPYSNLKKYEDSHRVALSTFVSEVRLRIDEHAETLDPGHNLSMQEVIKRNKAFFRYDDVPDELGIRFDACIDPIEELAGARIAQTRVDRKPSR
jgi:hypothetical protein